MAFVVLNYHFNLRKIFRDLERNGIQNAICPPGVKSSWLVCFIRPTRFGPSLDMTRWLFYELHFISK